VLERVTLPAADSLPDYTAEALELERVMEGQLGVTLTGEGTSEWVSGKQRRVSPTLASPPHARGWQAMLCNLGDAPIGVYRFLVTPLANATPVASPEAEKPPWIGGSSHQARLRCYLRGRRAGGSSAMAGRSRVDEAAAMSAPARMNAVPTPNGAGEWPPVALPLSARELDVLLLIAEGCRDHEIADQLYVSPHTVGNHVRNILGKLGAPTRAAAVARAARHGLL
jgi:DNA-binding CsgD family transcriptional regulator